MTAKRILLCEDDKYFNKLLADTLKKEGYEVRTAADGRAAQTLIENESFDLIITDMLLPRMMGMDLCRLAKTHKPDMPVIGMSGVYKDEQKIQELADEYGFSTYLAKPFNIDELLTACGQYLSEAKATSTDAKPEASAPETFLIPPTGDLSELPLDELMMRLYFRIETGILTLNQDKVKRKIFINNGFPVFATSTALSETLGAFLKAKKVVTEDQLAEASRTMVEQGRFLGEVLIDSGLIASDAFYHLLREQIYAILENCFTWTQGEFEYLATKQLDENLLKIEFNPVILIFRGRSRHTETETLERLASEHEADRIVQTDRFERLFPMLNLKGHIREALNGISDVPNLKLLLESVGETNRVPFLRVLDVMLATGMIRFDEGGELELIELASEEDDETFRPKTNPEATLAEISRVDFSHVVEPKAQAPSPGIHNDIAADYIRMMNKNYFEIFDLSIDATNEQIEEAYADKCDLYNLDRFEGNLTGEGKKMLNDIIAKLNRAHRTLTDQTLRTNYAAFVGQKSMDSATEAKQFLDAQQHARSAEKALRGQNFAEAARLYTLAHQSWPKGIEYAFNSTYCSFLERWNPENPRPAKKIYDSYLEKAQTYKGSDVYQLLKGHMLAKLGDLEAARAAYNEALRLNPSSESAQFALQSAGMIKREKVSLRRILGINKKTVRRAANMTFLALLMIGGQFAVVHYIKPEPDPFVVIDLTEINKVTPFVAAKKTKDVIEMVIDRSAWNGLDLQGLPATLGLVYDHLKPMNPREVRIKDSKLNLLAIVINRQTSVLRPPEKEDTPNETPQKESK